LFYAVSILARILQGVGDALLCVTIPSTITIYWQHNTEFYLGWFNASIGFGLIFGPMLAGFVNQYLNYSNTFFFFAAFHFVICIVSQILIPGSVNENLTVP